MKIHTNDQIDKAISNSTTCYLVEIDVMSNQNKKFFKGEKIKTGKLSRRSIHYYFNSTLVKYIYQDGLYYPYHIFTTLEEANAFIEKFKMEKYDVIRKKMIQRKKTLLEELDKLNKRFALLR